MADELGPAVTALQRKLDEQLQGVADTKRTINMLLKMSGQDPLYPDSDNERSGAVRADQFYGKGLATSAAEYLALRKQACQPEEILRGLEAGGFDFDVMGWQEDDRLRSFSISLAKNTGVAGKFHRLKNGTFGLRSWYDEDFLKKAAAGTGSAAKTKKKKVRGKAARTKLAEKQTNGQAQLLCSRGCGKPPHRGRCKPIADKSKSSAKPKSPLAADQKAQEEASA